jgi:hypothetical protein
MSTFYLCAPPHSESELYERLEYTPYGEVWIEWAERRDSVPVYGEGAGP